MLFLFYFSSVQRSIKGEKIVDMTGVNIATVSHKNAKQVTEKVIAICDYYGRHCKHINIYANGERIGAAFVDQTSQKRFEELAEWLQYVRYNRKTVYRGEIAQAAVASGAVREPRTGKIFATRGAWRKEVDRRLGVPMEDCISLERSSAKNHIVFPALSEGAGAYDFPFSIGTRGPTKSEIPERESDCNEATIDPYPKKSSSFHLPFSSYGKAIKATSFNSISGDSLDKAKLLISELNRYWTMPRRELTKSSV